MLLENVKIGYGEKVVASDISLHLKRGSLTCLLGANGCGKSTLLKTIAGFQRPLFGRILYEGVDLAEMSRKRLSRTVGIVLTQRAEAQNLTVRQLVSLGRSPYTGFFGRLSAEDEAIVNEAIDIIGIGVLSERIISTLSDGEYQKAMIAKTLAQQTPVMLFDEPTAFLDFASKIDLLETIVRLTRESGKTVLMSTHDISLALRTADQLLLMQGGAIRGCQGVEDVKAFVGAKASVYI